MQFDSKTFNPEVFHNYMERIPNLNRSELLKSKALVTYDKLKTIFSPQTGSYKGTLPYFGKIGKNTKNYDGATDITANTSETYSQSYIVVGRADAWVENDFSADITGGVDFMDNVAVQVAEYWDEVDTTTLTKVLTGIFGMTTNTDFVNNHTYDISLLTGALNKFNTTTLNSAIQKASGDNKNKFELAIMHSQIATNLENINLLEYLKYTDENGVQRNLQLATLNGKMVLIDDGVPFTEVVTVIEVQGTWTLEISTAFANDEELIINGITYTKVASNPGEEEFTGADVTAQAASLVIAVNRHLTYLIATSALGVLTFTQRVGGYGVIPTASESATTGVLESVAAGVSGVEEVKVTTYTTYTFGAGAIQYSDVGAQVPVEMDRDPKVNGGQDTLYGRQRKVFAPKGISFIGTPASLSPTDAELSSGANWDVVNNGKTAGDKEYIDHRAILISRIISLG